MKRKMKDLPWLFVLLLMIGLLGACTMAVEPGAVRASSNIAQTQTNDDEDIDDNNAGDEAEDEDEEGNDDGDEKEDGNGEVNDDIALIDCAMTGSETAEISESKLYIEYNASDGDLGVHGAFDDDCWSELCVTDPGGSLILAVKPQSALADLTMAGIFFESREPPVDEFGFNDLATDFPEGEYTVRALTYDGVSLTGAASFTHDVPVEPEITSPALAEDEETIGDAAVPATDLVIEWADVTETVSGDPITITGYEVIVTKVEHDDPNGFSRPLYDVHVPADLNSLAVPDAFIEADTVYELEILALEESGNQTISVGFFQTQ